MHYAHAHTHVYVFEQLLYEKQQQLQATALRCAKRSTAGTQISARPLAIANNQGVRTQKHNQICVCVFVHVYGRIGESTHAKI